MLRGAGQPEVAVAAAEQGELLSGSDPHPVITRRMTPALSAPAATIRAMSTDQELAAVPAAAANRPETGRDAITIGQDHGSGVEHFQLICPRSSEVWDTPANAGFDRAAIIARLDTLRAGGNDYELTDGDALSKHERSDRYGQACSALARAGNRYSIRQVFGSRRHGGGDHLGFGVPALLVFKNGEPVDVYPHQVGDRYQTIRRSLDTL